MKTPTDFLYSGDCPNYLNRISDIGQLGSLFLWAPKTTFFLHMTEKSTDDDNDGCNNNCDFDDNGKNSAILMISVLASMTDEW